MLIHIYSIGYMAHEGGYYRFFGYLNLFMFSMLTLILANNYALMFVGWEGVGLCSYLLIGFYFLRHSASTAANKAFIVNRVGDAGFLLGMFMIAWRLRFGAVHAGRTQSRAAGSSRLAIPGLQRRVCFCCLSGACGKSAQFPLHVWLPDAMEGPTPVFGADPRRDHGYGGRVHGGAVDRVVCAGSARHEDGGDRRAR